MLSFEPLEDRSLLSVSASTSAAAGLLYPQPINVAAVSTVEATAASDNGTLAQTDAVAAITSVRDGLWSNPATWSSNRVPGPTDDVVITNNITIDQGSVRELDINAGTTTLAGTLQAYASVIVRSSLVGTHGGIYFHVADDRLFTGDTNPGPDPTMPDFHPEDIGLWALRGSHIDLQGAQVSSWLNAMGSGALVDIGKGVAQQVSFGATNAMLQSAPIGWQPGDTLLLVNEQGRSVLADLVSVNGTSIQYHQHKINPTDADLVGHDLITAGSSTVVHSKLADLTRRIQIVSADVREGDSNHRAHTTYLDGATVNLINVEFRDLGTRGKLGDYPVYFDQSGAVTSSLTGSSIWQDVTDPGNRFVALHAVQGVTVANNVAFRSQGDGFFMEDGGDYGNSITSNLSVQVTGSEELPNADSNVTGLTHHFWLRTGNTISGNVAAGGDAVGMIILASMRPNTTAVLDLEVLGAGLYGFWTGTPSVTFNNPVAVYNSRAGFGSDPAWDVDSHGATLNNPLFLFNGTSDFAYGAQLYLNDSDGTVINGGVLAGVRAFNTHYHSTFAASNAKIDVDTLLVPTYWEQAATLTHDQIQASLLFDRSYPSPRYASPGLVRFVGSDVQIGSAAAETETSDYIGQIFQNYPGLQGTPIPNAIELLQPAADSGFIRVTLLPDDQRWMTNIARWTVTPIGQTPQADSFIYQRQTAWTGLASFGGYPDGFPPGQYAVSLYTADGVLLKSGFAVVRSDQVSDITATLSTNSLVVGRELFYNQSKWDGHTAGVSPSDDLAIPGDKTAYLPNSGAATFSNVSSYSKGINGIMVDLLGSGSHTSITQAGILNDFTFKVGNDNSPGAWVAAPNPINVAVRAGVGVSGSDRVELIWADDAIQQQWLEVTVLATADTGLVAGDVFYFGSEIGDTGASNTVSVFKVGNSDTSGVQTHMAPQGAHNSITNIYDFNRDGSVGTADVTLDQTHSTTTSTGLQVITIGAGGPLSPPPAAAPAANGSGQIAVASALVSSSQSPAPPAIPSWIVNRLTDLDLNHGSVAKYLEHLAHDNTAKSKAILVKADQIADALNLDHELLDGLSAG